MQEIASTRFSVSYHLKDLLKRDAQTVQEIANWLETRAEKPRDRANRTGSKRMMARLIAAKQLLRGLEDTVSAESVMNRTEGKVADRLIKETRAVHLHFGVTAPPHQLTDNPVTHTLQTTDYKLVTERALDQASSVDECKITGPISRRPGEPIQEKGGQEQIGTREDPLTSNAMHEE